ncbi:MAG: hypothetical protein ABIH11_01510 [Candidatus Altiarchaeota archaeon]
MNKGFVLLLVLILPQYASAWGPDTHRNICGSVISETMGDSGVECLHKAGLGYCGLVREVTGVQAYDKCVEFVGEYGSINVLDITDDFFGELENHRDYSKCPIWKWNDHRNWICPSEYAPSSTAVEYAGRWFQKSAESKDDCLKAQAYCMGAMYYADARYPLYQVSEEYLGGCSGMSLADEVDMLVGGDGGWSVSKFCSFTHWKQITGRKIREDAKILFKVDDKTIGGIISELSGDAGQWITGSTSTLTTTSTVKTTTTTVKTTTTSIVKTTTTTTIKTTTTTSLRTTTTLEELVDAMIDATHTTTTMGGAAQTTLEPPADDELASSTTDEEEAGYVPRGLFHVDGVDTVVKGDEQVVDDSDLKDFINTVRSIVNKTGIGKTREGSGKTALRYFTGMIVLVSLGFTVYVANRVYNKPSKKRGD